MKLKHAVYTTLVLLHSIQASTQSTSTTFGVYWGTFDPPTRAHEHVILQAFSLSIDRLFVVINNHGHKQYNAALEDRIAMLKLILPTSYPITVLIQDKAVAWGMQELKNSFGAYPEVSWYLFSGQENLAYWNPCDADIHDTLVIMPRADSKTIIPAGVTLLTLPPVCNTISSSAVRSSIQRKTGDWYAMVPEHVMEFIKEHSLYQHEQLTTKIYTK